MDQPLLTTIATITVAIINHNSWLVVWNINFIFPYIGNLIIPIDELIFFRGVAQPPTRPWFYPSSSLCSKALPGVPSCGPHGQRSATSVHSFRGAPRRGRHQGCPNGFINNNITWIYYGDLMWFIWFYMYFYADYHSTMNRFFRDLVLWIELRSSVEYHVRRSLRVQTPQLRVDGTRRHRMWPSGKLTVCCWKRSFIVDLPMKNGGFP